MMTCPVPASSFEPGLIRRGGQRYFEAVIKAMVNGSVRWPAFSVIDLFSARSPFAYATHRCSARGWTSAHRAADPDADDRFHARISAP